MHEPADSSVEHRRGVLAGLAAYGLWGMFPLVFHQLADVSALEVLAHRVVWSFVVVAVLVVAGRSWPTLRISLRDRRRVGRLAAAGLLVATNWLVYIWAVEQGRVVDAALGYYVNPLITVALGVVVLRERLRRGQQVALLFGAAAVVVLTVAYGRPPWIALVLAFSFAGYGFLKKSTAVTAVHSLAVETAALLPAALAGLLVLEAAGDAAFLDGSGGRDALLVSLGLVTAVPLLLFGVAASRIPLSLLGLLQYVTPTGQLVCGVLILGEDLPPERLAGFVLVWIALAVLAVDAVRASRRVEPVPVAEPV